jgi:hypothetical protein
MAQNVSLWMSLRFGQLEVNFSADEVSGYAPDVANDMAIHVVRAFSEGIAELRGHGVIGSIDDDLADDTEDEDDSDEDDSEDESDEDA